MDIATSALRPMLVSIVAQAITIPCVQDRHVEGVYRVEIDPQVQREHAAQVALDVFHARVPIAILDDFEIDVIDRDGVSLALDGFNARFSGERLGRLL